MDMAEANSTPQLDKFRNNMIITRPDDWHLHVREGTALKSVVPDTAKQFKRAIIMPNLANPVTTVAHAKAYREEILAAVPDSDFEPLMTLYLTDNTTAETIREAKESGFIHALKLYPAGATTNSDKGVSDLKNIYPALEAMQEAGILLLVHGEVTDPAIDIFDREQVFIDTILKPLIAKFPTLKVVLEHITTSNAVEFVSSAPDNIGATITAHHLLMNRNDIFTGGIRPHHYCLPILKRETHRQALVKAAISGSPKFFLGTDSAPHTQSAKETACGCAGMYTALHAMELYTEAFDKADALDKLEAFASFYGPDFYGLPRNSGTIELSKETWEVPESLAMGDENLIPLRAGEHCHWKLIS
ncbi:dihydroorotase [uncultured Cocleimonas sp.]|uniref:dihydroorotase n=1 Tax=uncultured Cocleimonas sp. TaxID=1051587 RepID=UPI002623B7A3|nr:dihydroorotase [uncultured Cocleimonas sp.]